MGKINKKLLGIAAASMLAASPAWAVPFGDGGTALQGVLDDITVDGAGSGHVTNSSINVATDEYTPDAYWELTAANNSGISMIVEIAGFANGNKFGIYQMGDTTNTVQLFDGPDTAANPSGQTNLTFWWEGGNTYSVFVDGSDSGSDFVGDRFGFYLDSSGQSINGGPLNGAVGGLFYSDASLNDGGYDYMAAYQGNNTDRVQTPGVGPNGKVWTDNEIILAWEDLDNSTGTPFDNDYTDFVVMIESVLPVPAPATLALLGLGLIGMAYRVRRKTA